MTNQVIFYKYKPLRNHLRQLRVDDSFFVIWAYMQHLQFDQKMPTNEIEVSKDFLMAEHFSQKMFFPWELELLSREVIINSRYDPLMKETMRKWRIFRGAINKIKDLEDFISDQTINSSNILKEVNRTAHRQFPWQIRPDHAYMMRYYKIFGDGLIRKIVEAHIGLTIEKLYTISLMFIGSTLSSCYRVLPLSINIPTLASTDLEIFLDRYSINLSELRQKIAAEEEINDKFAYSYSSLRAFPIIKMKYKGSPSLVFPMPTLLYWRVTSGLYYDLVKQNGFDEAFGRAFQNYVGEVLHASQALKRFSIIEESQYLDGKKRKDTIDWILEEKGAALFLECKTKRLTNPAKISLDDTEPIDKDLEKMADFICQTYRSIRDYKQGKYPLIYDSNRTIFPFVLTLEDWRIMGPEYRRDLDNKVKEKLALAGIDHAVLVEMPYSICPIEEFEILVQVLQKVGIKKFMEIRMAYPEKNSYSFSPFMNEEFKNELKGIQPIFTDEFDKTFKVNNRGELGRD